MDDLDWICHTHTIASCHLQCAVCCYRALREEWIKAKYERLEFQDIDKQQYRSGHKEGHLMKLGKNTTTRYNKRRFLLSLTDGTLRYFTKEDVSFIIENFLASNVFNVT